MKYKNMFKVILIVIIIGAIGCKEKIKNQTGSPENYRTGVAANIGVNIIDIGNVENEQKLKSLNLDNIYPNPINSKNISESEKKSIVDSWSDLVSKLSDFMVKEKFDWENDNKVRLYQKVYFSKNGKVDYYTFNVKSQNVTEKKKIEFAELLEKFSKDLKFDVESKDNFWQCGTTIY